MLEEGKGREVRKKAGMGKDGRKRRGEGRKEKGKGGENEQRKEGRIEQKWGWRGNKRGRQGKEEEVGRKPNFDQTLLN